MEDPGQIVDCIGAELFEPGHLFWRFGIVLVDAQESIHVAVVVKIELVPVDDRAAVQHQADRFEIGQRQLIECQRRPELRAYCPDINHSRGPSSGESATGRHESVSTRLSTMIPGPPRYPPGNAARLDCWLAGSRSVRGCYLLRRTVAISRPPASNATTTFPITMSMESFIDRSETEVQKTAEADLIPAPRATRIRLAFTPKRDGASRSGRLV